MSASNVTIDVSELRVGMFVHLDLGWMSHPFPLSSFKIANAQQIETIRGLGLTQLRWSPERSDMQPARVPAEPDLPCCARDPDERQLRRQALAAQRAALHQCDRQYAEAGRAWRAVADVLPGDPQGAREMSESLTRTLLAKMVDEREICIRLLTESAGDRASAHALNVAVIALLMGRVFGLQEDDMLDLGMGALLHDIGKLDIPDRVRHFDESFNAVEAALYRDHVTHGVSRGRKMGLAPGALLVIAQHHEQADGSGFPQHLNVDRMTAAARIVSLVNRYDNLCNPAVPSRAITPHEALSQMFAQSKHKFDATMLNTFIRMMGVYPPGSVVQLTDDRYAMVMTVNSSRPLKPRVLVHDVRVPCDEALYLDLETTPSLGIRRSIKPAQLPASALDYLAPRTRVAYFFEPGPPLADSQPSIH